MLEVPVAYSVENRSIRRPKAAVIVGSIITSISLVIVFNFDPLFDMVVSFTTERSQPLLSLFICIFVAWIWRRNEILEEIRQGSPEAEQGVFWKIWPSYVKFVCPVAILAVYFQ